MAEVTTLPTLHSEIERLERLLGQLTEISQRQDKTSALLSSTIVVASSSIANNSLSGADMIRGIGAGGGGGYIRTSIQALGVVHRLYNLVNKIEKEVLRINSSLEGIDAKIGSPTPPPNEDSNVR